MFDFQPSMDTALNLNPRNEKCQRSETVEHGENWNEVTQRIAMGDQDAFAIYYEAYFDPMLREVKRLTAKDEQTCLDIVQEAMLKVIRCIKPIETESKLLAWTKTVAKSVAYDWLRKRARQKLTALSDVDPMERDDKFVDQARLQWIEEEIKTLPANLQNMIDLRYRLGWSLQQIARKFGLKTGATDGRIRRAIKNLKEKALREFDE